MSATSLLYQVAANGSSKYSEIEPSDNLIVKHILDEFADAELARQILLSTGADYFYQRAAYVPACDNRLMGKLWSMNEIV